MASPAADYRSPAGMPLDGILLAEELLDLAERAQAYTNAAGVVIALMRGKELLVRTSAGAAPEVGTVIPATDAFVAECLQRGKPLSCRDTEADSRVGQIFRATKTRSLIAIPIAGQPQPRGVMLVIAPLPNSFQPTHTAILMTLSDIISSKLAAREAPSDVKIEIVNDPPPALTVVAEAPPQPAVPEMSVIAPAPVVGAPSPMVAAPLPAVAPPPATPATPPLMPAAPPPVAKAAPPRVESAPAPAEAAPMAVAVEAKAPEMPAVKSGKREDSQPEPSSIAPSLAASSAAGLPAVLKPGLMPLVEQKKSEREPGLLSPSEDPGRFKPQRAFAANTVATVRPELMKINPKPVAPVAITATPAPAQPVSFSATPAIASWETPRPDSPMRRYLVPALAVAAVLVVAAVLWMRRSPAAPSPPAISAAQVAAAVTPAPAAVALTPPAPAPVAPQVKLVAKVEPSVKAVEQRAQPKPVKTPEVQAVSAPSKQVPAPPMEIAAAQPKPKLEPEPEMPVPKLALAAGDNALAALGKVAVARPAPPKSEVVPATLISRTAPVYPPVARQLGIAGTVVLNVTVTADGSVGEVRVLDGAMQLRAAAVDAVRRWRYQPATLNGKPVESSAHVQVRFTR